VFRLSADGVEDVCGAASDPVSMNIPSEVRAFTDKDSSGLA
jgi:hypothetical protein